MTHRFLIALTACLACASTAGAQDADHVARERARIQMHLSHVETVLRARDVSHLNEAQRAARARHLDTLHAYWSEGRFPINDTRPEAYTPIFIDAHDTACAVGYLIVEDDHEDLARRVQAEQNYAYVPDIQTPGLLEWATSAGFTVDELAMIQPAYCGPAFDAAPCGAADAGPGGGSDDGGCSIALGGPGAPAWLPLAGLALLLVRRRR